MGPSQYRANAAINTSVFVKQVGDWQIETAGAGEDAVGVMHESSWDTPGIAGTDVDVAVPAGESKRVYQKGEECEIRVGTGGLTAGQFVKPDASGHGIAAVATDNYSARCIQGGAAGERARVKIEHGSV